MSNLFSVVIPIYNIEKYISECIDSVLNQSYKNIEILLVNDGSEDNSQSICEFYSKKDNRVRLINKKNGGLSSARNKGIEVARGNYIIFLDGDDYWDDKNALEKINNNLEESKADVLLLGLKKRFEDTGKIEEARYIFNREHINLESKKDTLNYLVKNNLYISSAWSKVVKKDLIDKYNLRFEDKALSEDIEWSARLLLYSENIDVIESSFYIYRQRSNSISHSITLKNIEYLIKHIDTCIDIYQKDRYEDIELEYMSYVAYQYITLLISINILNEDIPKIIMNKIKSERYLLKYNLINRVHIFYLINRYLGFNIFMLIIKAYLILRKG